MDSFHHLALFSRAELDCVRTYICGCRRYLNLFACRAFYNFYLRPQLAESIGKKCEKVAGPV